MAYPLLLSHSHSDKDLAREVADLVRTVSLEQLDVWFSSDERSGQGLLAGERWAETLRTKLGECKAVLALVTPRSIERPWLYFESGFGAAVAELEVIPICVHVRPEGASYPLSMYQSYPLDGAESAASFLKKLFGRFGLGWMDSLVEVELEPRMKSILELASRKYDRGYEIQVEIEPDRGEAISCALTRDDRVQDVLDEIFYELDDAVPAHTYLEKWVLVQSETEQPLIVRGLAAAARARDVFERGSHWRVLLLDEPYQAAGDRRLMAQYYRRFRRDQRDLD